MLIQLTCPGCGQTTEVDHEDRATACPSCGKYTPVRNVGGQAPKLKAGSLLLWVAAIVAALVVIPMLTTIISPQSVSTLVYIPAAICLYFLPSALGWKKRNRTAIVLLNAFLGWTFIGWVVALVWAATKDRP